MEGVRIPRDALQLENEGCHSSGYLVTTRKRGVGELRDLTCRSMYCAISLPSPIYNSKTGGVSYDFLVVDTIGDAETVEKRRKCGGCGPFKICFTPPPTSSYDGNVGWVSPLFEFYSSGLTDPIHTLGGAVCYVSKVLKRTSGYSSISSTRRDSPALCTSTLPNLLPATASSSSGCR